MRYRAGPEDSFPVRRSSTGEPQQVPEEWCDTVLTALKWGRGPRQYLAGYLSEGDEVETEGAGDVF